MDFDQIKFDIEEDKRKLQQELIEELPCIWCGCYELRIINESDSEMSHRPQVHCDNPKCEARGPRNFTREDAIEEYRKKVDI